MKIDILTLFPNMFNGFLSESIIKRAIENGNVIINVHNIRDYTVYKNNQVDDTPYGGGAGMVLMCDPIFRAVEALKSDDSKVIIMSPQGKVFNQKTAYNLSREKHLIIICGHYEGFDERILSIVDMEISIGDYILTGGEIPSMAITDAVVRLIDGVITSDSHMNDSFNNNLLDYPTYTKPRIYNDMEVPDVLLSGHHGNIEKWRKEKQIEKTKKNRPDLMEDYYE
ncbi:MAG: tRNA (guanosine(37)-N1)-methyltransferase TrmD [Firmicutes bacterium]|nr:tRNA (guanosine(37)-N1)-methyltransferase TrmD [Bacillota bacterium]